MMCNYSYKNFSVNKKNHSCKIGEYIIDIPLDYHGKCVFHSEDKEWKQNQNFTVFLEKYITYCKENKLTLDFREIHFVAEKGKTQIDYIDLLAYAELEDAHFHDTILMVGVNKQKIINGNLNFISCVFYHDVIFKNCLFCYEFKMEHITLKGDFGVLNMQFEDCDFEYYFEFSDIQDFSSNLTIKRCKFKENVLFQSLFTLENEFEIVNNEFLKGLSFADSEIKALAIDFSHNTFIENAEFNNVAFNGATLFNSPIVVSKLIFTGTQERKIFCGQTQFCLIESNIQGQVIFQLTDLTLIDGRDLEVMKELEKVGIGHVKKVVIGTGCIKYRLMTPDLTYYIKEGHHYLISEIGTSFATYFAQHNGFNLGIEVRTKTKDSITLFYFTDEDISDEEFFQLLGVTSQRIFGLISGDSNSVMIDDDAIMNLKVNLVSTFIKTSLQIHKGNWTQSDSKALFGPLIPTPTYQLDENVAHDFLQSKSVQDVLDQTNGLNLIVIQGNDGVFIGGDVNANSVVINKKT